MRMTSFFSITLREPPTGTEAVSHQLLLRAGFIRQVGQGLYALMPLGKRSVMKIEQIIREEMNAINGQEISMPVVNPAEIWKQTGRWSSVGPEMARFKDRKDRDMVLAMTHEEIVTYLAAGDIKSYRQLPQMVYHLQTKFRDDPRPRAGLIRVREFTMKDSYTFDVDDAGLDKQYDAHYAAYFKIYARCRLPVIAVGSDTGMMGGSQAHEYMYLTPIGEDTLVLCDACGYAANKQIAAFAKPAAPSENALSVEKVATPHCKTIEALAALLNVLPRQTAKAVFLVASAPDARDRFVFAVVRGDMQLNETKLTNVLKCQDLRPATEAEIRAAGAVPGYASPIGLTTNADAAMTTVIVVDDAITTSVNLVAGANDEGFHLKNTNCPRDFTPDHVADIAAADEGCGCIKCNAPLRTARGVEVGNIFKLGTRYSTALGANFLDASGASHPIVMGSYGIGVGRLLACAAEHHNDARGLMLPASIAPFAVHLLVLKSKDGSTEATAERIYASMRAAGIDVLFDDRDESPGVKFADADLIGLPRRITVGGKGLAGGTVELKARDSDDKINVPIGELISRLS